MFRHFYELQLIILGAFCLFILSIERCLSNSNREKRSKDLADSEHSGEKSNVLAALTRQYLVVYAIVMGE